VPDRSYVTLVSGLPRSGTSMMMKMLEAGGMPVLTDNIRTADEDNPRGYYELEQVKQIERDQSWLPGARGKVVKMISALLKHLPEGYEYRVLFMRRKLEEVLASQRQMLIRRGKPADPSGDEKMATYFARHLAQVDAWLAERPHFKVLDVSYNEMVANPTAHVARIDRFLDGGLDVEKMKDVVAASLYRQRG
jgi:hypothetical protein